MVYLPTIIYQLISHGETYTVVNISGPTLDNAFLHSAYLTIDRSEKKSQVDPDDDQRSYDAIIRTRPPFARIDLGFVEAKSGDRYANQDQDRVKIKEALRRALTQIRHIVADAAAMAKVLVFGVLCHGG